MFFFLFKKLWSDIFLERSRDCAGTHVIKVAEISGTIRWAAAMLRSSTPCMFSSNQLAPNNSDFAQAALQRGVSSCACAAEDTARWS